MDFQRNGRCKNLILLFFLSDAVGFDFSPFYATCIVSSRYYYRWLTIQVSTGNDTSRVKRGVEVAGERTEEEAVPGRRSEGIAFSFSDTASFVTVLSDWSDYGFLSACTALCRYRTDFGVSN